MAVLQARHFSLAAHGESKARREQREARSHAVPRLEATAPNQVWTWDVSNLATHTSGVFLNLYLVLDLFSRFPVAWMIAERENSAPFSSLHERRMRRDLPGVRSVQMKSVIQRSAPLGGLLFVDGHRCLNANTVYCPQEVLSCHTVATLTAV